LPPISPYNRGSNYILKMGDFKTRRLVRDDGMALYWRFIDHHRHLLPCLTPLSIDGELLDKMDPDAEPAL